MTLLEHYQTVVAPKLAEEFGFNNKMAIPRITKVVVNMGLKEAVHDKGILAKAGEQLTSITGQKAKVTKARTSIANFKLREGDPVGLTVTLRGKRMYDFMTKLFTIVLPRVRDFHGVPTRAFDREGNYTLGMSEQISFPEIDYSKIDKIRGLEMTFVTNIKKVAIKTPVSEGARGARESALLAAQARHKIAQQLLSYMGMPFEKN